MYNLPTTIVAPTTAPAVVSPLPQGPSNGTIPRQATHDEQLIEMWLHGRPETTQLVYRRHLGRFLGLVNKPLPQVTVGDVQAFTDSLAAELVKLRYFAGLTSDQAAQALGVSARTADRIWVYARSFLLREIEEM